MAMKLDEFRREMEEYRRDVDEEARSLKDSYLALERLQTLYRKFDADQREMADRVLAEWVVSGDEKVRFDALALIDEFRIASGITALRELADRLTTSGAPGAPYELQKVQRIMRSIAGPSS